MIAREKIEGEGIWILGTPGEKEATQRQVGSTIIGYESLLVFETPLRFWVPGSIFLKLSRANESGFIEFFFLFKIWNFLNL